tara:strand:+ start:2277 stop:3197 length:921 start_codon:yes stop_codon:yes gene_type:complete
MDIPRNISATIDAASKNYRRYPGVCGVSFGAKISNNDIQMGVEAVQFFVSEKIDPSDLPRQLPKHVYLRTDDGDVDHGTSIPTDVIELKNLQLCCFSGDFIGNELGAEGSVALIFENRADDDKIMLLTCSHVASDLLSTEDSFDMSGGGGECFFQATTTAFTTVDGDVLEFDLALAEITQIDGLQPLEVRGTQVRVTDFAKPENFSQGDIFDCQSDQSGGHKISLQSAATTFQNVEADDVGTISVGNLYACKGNVERGDSGGFVYSGNLAVGIIVAKADDGWVFIHALSDAIAFLETKTGVSIQVF